MWGTAQGSSWRGQKLSSEIIARVGVNIRTKVLRLVLYIYIYIYIYIYYLKNISYFPREWRWESHFPPEKKSVVDKAFLASQFKN